MQLHLYQIWYDAHSKPAKDSGLQPFDCRQNPEFLKRETAHLIRFYGEIVASANDDAYFALLSPRFYEKTGLKPAQIIGFLRNNVGYDVYLFNPYPMNVYYNLNVWQQGEHNHPGLLKLTNYLFSEAKVDFDVYAPHRNNIYNAVYCNYWVGSKQFYDQFISFLRHLDNTIHKLPNDKQALFFNQATYRTQASFYPFVFERMLSTYLLMNSEIKSKPYIYTKPFTGYHKLNRIESKFYFSDERSFFDEWENNQKDLKKIQQGFSMLSEVLYPNFNYFNNNNLNKLVRSLIKTLNISKIKDVRSHLSD